MTDKPERLRPAALAFLQRARDLNLYPSASNSVEFMVKALASETPSFLLPVNGNYIDAKTPGTYTGNNLYLPDADVILEYSMSGEGSFYNPSDGTFKPSAALILVAQTSAGRTMFFTLFRATLGGRNCWIPPAIGVVFYSDSRIVIDRSGAVATTKVTVESLLDKQYNADDVARLLRGCVDEMKVVLHFVSISRSTNIAIQSHQWPPAMGSRGIPVAMETYHTLTCKGPTSFKWLPTSGMSAS